MAAEPLQQVVRLILESEGYFVRSNVRFEMKYPRAGKMLGAYSDLDLVAVKVDPSTGRVVDRLWGEVKAHLTSSFTRGYVIGFMDDYAAMLSEKALRDPDLVKRADPGMVVKLRHKRKTALEVAQRELGGDFGRRLYFGGRWTAGEVGARALLDPSVEVRFLADEIPRWAKCVSHQEGNEDLARLVCALRAYGLLRVDGAE